MDSGSPIAPFDTALASLEAAAEHLHGAKNALRPLGDEGARLIAGIQAESDRLAQIQLAVFRHRRKVGG